MLDFSRLSLVKPRRPLIHCVSNQVSANDCANLALAVGASPIMAQAPEEAAAITAASAATVLNTGTPDTRRFADCLVWGKAAAALAQPLIVDPVGVGASPWRLEQVSALLAVCTPSILRVNLGEAEALTHAASSQQGVDSPAPADPARRLAQAQTLARQTTSTVLLSGAEDLITDGNRTLCVSGGSPRMVQVTGTGCMLSALCGVFAAVEADPFSAAALAAAFWKVCSARAERSSAGPGSFRIALFDEAARLTAEDLRRQAQIQAL